MQLTFDAFNMCPTTIQIPNQIDSFIHMSGTSELVDNTKNTFLNLLYFHGLKELHYATNLSDEYCLFSAFWCHMITPTCSLKDLDKDEIITSAS